MKTIPGTRVLPTRNSIDLRAPIVVISVDYIGGPARNETPARQARGRLIFVFAPVEPSMLPNDTIVDRRRMVRYPAFARVKIQLSAPDRELFYRAHVQDISRGGIKLRVDRLFETGTVGKVLLDVPLNARVVYASALSYSGWVVGCVFAQELNNGEFKQLRKELS